MSARSLIVQLIILLIIIQHNNAYFWTPLSPYPGPPRHHPVNFANSTHGFLLTGSIREGNGGFSPSNDVYAYSVSKDEWKKLPDFPGGKRSFSVGMTLGNYGYVGFGINDKNLFLGDLWRFDLISNEWSRMKSCPGFGRMHPAMVGVGGKIYVGAGNGINESTGQFENFNDFWEYDVPSNTWLPINSLPGIARHHPYFFNVDNSVFVGLGHSKQKLGERDWYKLEDRKWQRLGDFVSFDAGTWNIVTTEGRVAGTQGSIDSCGLGFVLSGDGDDHSTMEEGEFHIYYKDSDRWLRLPPHPGVSRWAPGSFVIGTKVYFTSGLDRSTKAMNSDLWSFDAWQYC